MGNKNTGLHFSLKSINLQTPQLSTRTLVGLSKNVWGKIPLSKSISKVFIIPTSAECNNEENILSCKAVVMLGEQVCCRGLEDFKERTSIRSSVKHVHYSGKWLDVFMKLRYRHLS